MDTEFLLTSKILTARDICEESIMVGRDEDAVAVMIRVIQYRTVLYRIMVSSLPLIMTKETFLVQYPVNFTRTSPGGFGNTPCCQDIQQLRRLLCRAIKRRECSHGRAGPSSMCQTLASPLA